MKGANSLATPFISSKEECIAVKLSLCVEPLARIIRIGNAMQEVGFMFRGRAHVLNEELGMHRSR